MVIPEPLEYILGQIPEPNHKSADYGQCMMEEKLTNEFEHLCTITQMYSATMPQKLVSLTKKHLKFPVEVLVTKKDKTRSNINHYFEFLANNSEMKNNKRRLLKIWLKRMEPQIIIFVSTKTTCEHLAKMVSLDGFKASSYHSGFEQKKREDVISRFKRKWVT